MPAPESVKSALECRHRYWNDQFPDTGAGIATILAKVPATPVQLLPFTVPAQESLQKSSLACRLVWVQRACTNQTEGLGLRLLQTSTSLGSKDTHCAGSGGDVRLGMMSGWG